MPREKSSGRGSIQRPETRHSTMAASRWTAISPSIQPIPPCAAPAGARGRTAEGHQQRRSKLTGYTPTIGDRLDDAGVAWHWYSGGWADALSGKADKTFQFHRQPLAYYARYVPFQEGGTTLNPKTTAPTAHLQDESQFYIDLAEGKLPAVCFVKPKGAVNECPGCAGLLAGQQHAADIVHAVQNSPLWQRTAILVLYTDSGGRWDHVPPPKRDKFGPGCRVPAPSSRRTPGGEACSMPPTIRFRSSDAGRPLWPAGAGASDAAAASLADCFQAEARAAIDVSYTQPDADRPGRWRWSWADALGRPDPHFAGGGMDGRPHSQRGQRDRPPLEVPHRAAQPHRSLRPGGRRQYPDRRPGDPAGDRPLWRRQQLRSHRRRAGHRRGRRRRQRDRGRDRAQRADWRPGLCPPQGRPSRRHPRCRLDRLRRGPGGVASDFEAVGLRRTSIIPSAWPASAAC